MTGTESVDLSFLQRFAMKFGGIPILHDNIFFVVIIGILAPFCIIGIALIIRRRIKR